MKHIVIVAPSRSGHNWTCKMIRNWINGEIKLYQFEAVNPELYQVKVRQRIWHGLKPVEGDEVIAFLQVRDLLNFAASWTKYNLRRGRAYKRQAVIPLFDNWLKIAKEANNETSYIGDKYTLLYDQFVQSEAYRRSVCSLIGGEYNEEKIDFVPPGGGGSSFDLRKMNENGREMKVMDRWKWYLTEEGEDYIEYLKVKKNVVEYYAEKFDLTDGQSKLVNEILK